MEDNIKKNQIHVVKNDDDSWAVIRKHSRRTIFRTETQSKAIRKAVLQAKREGHTEVIIIECPQCGSIQIE